MIFPFADIARSLAGFMQAVLTLMVLVLSLGYMLVTRRIRRERCESFIGISAVTADGRTISAAAENLGASDALNVSITALLGNRRRKRKVFLLGPAVIPADAKRSFRGNAGAVPPLSQVTLKVRYRSSRKAAITEYWSLADSGVPLYRGTHRIRG